MSDFHLARITDLRALTTLPRLAPSDGEVLDRLLWLAPEVALSTAAAVIRTNQPELHELLFGRRDGRNAEPPDVGKLARALVYLGLATAAPKQGKILPILAAEHLRAMRADVPLRVARWGQAAAVGRSRLLEEEILPDGELRNLVGTLVQQFSGRTLRDPRWLRSVAFAEASALYDVMAVACRTQFAGMADVGDVADRLERVARTGALLADALAPEPGLRSFDQTKQREYVERLRRFGWEERVASQGRTLREIAADGAPRGFIPTTSFAFSDEWGANGASDLTDGRRYFIRPALLPDSGGLALWAQEERLKPLQKMLAGDPTVTGLRLTLATVEVLLEFAIDTGLKNFLDGSWTRTANRFAEMHTRIGGFSDGSFGVSLFPRARFEDSVGVCPIVLVEVESS
jgi:hypothetical protein